MIRALKLLGALELALAIGSSALFADGIFADKNLEAAVRKYVLAKRDNDQPLAAEDLKSLSTIHADKKQIKDLKGLEACIALAELRLAGNEVTDLTPLKDLKNLQSLDLARNKVSDLKPLEGLKGLQYLNL